jgi:hypothetical protein
VACDLIMTTTDVSDGRIASIFWMRVDQVSEKEIDYKSSELVLPGCQLISGECLSYPCNKPWRPVEL